MSSQRHWHEGEDEFLLMVSGELMLVENDGECLMQAGDMAGFKAGVAKAITWSTGVLARRSFLLLGTRASPDICHYPDIDLKFESDEKRRALCQQSGRFL